MTPAELKTQIPIYRDGNIYMTDGDEHCIMRGNEEVYIKESIRLICERIHPRSVRELGFGFGFTADEFQAQGVKKHVIYEPNDHLYRKACAWAEGKRGVTVVNSRFEDAPNDERVDLVYNDIYGMCNEGYRMADMGDVRRVFQFDWYAEFCNEDDKNELLDGYFRFRAGGHTKLQLLIRNDGSV